MKRLCRRLRTTAATFVDGTEPAESDLPTHPLPVSLHPLRAAPCPGMRQRTIMARGKGLGRTIYRRGSTEGLDSRPQRVSESCFFRVSGDAFPWLAWISCKRRRQTRRLPLSCTLFWRCHLFQLCMGPVPLLLRAEGEIVSS